MNNDLELHMGEAMHVFDALKDECLDSNLYDEHLGAMGAYRVEKWSTKIGVLLEYTEANGGCSLKITTPQPAHAEQDGWKLVPIEPTPAMMVEGTLVSEFQADPAGMYRAMLAAAPKPESE